MPGLAEQHRRMGQFTTSFTVLRFLLTRLKMTYEAAKKLASPYDKIVAFGDANADRTVSGSGSACSPPKEV